MNFRRFLPCWLAAVIGVFLAMGSLQAQTPKGHLFIIGGGDRPPEMMRQFVALAGGSHDAIIVIIPNASADPDTECMDMTAEFRTLGVKEVRCHYLRRDEASKPGAAAWLEGATGVYFTGGDQSRVNRDLVGTQVQEKLLELYADGAVIGGTSAGAALMSKVMLTGDERLNPDTVHGFVFIRKDNVVTIEGMGFLTNAIIDQHFVVRKRHNRLISVVLEHPDLVAVGIDESTAIIVDGGDRFTVTGKSNVVVYDATRATDIRHDARGTLSARGITMHLLVAGDRYDIGARKVLQPAVDR